MKRTNLVLDERLLEETVRLSGQKTYSRAVECALEAFVRQRRAWRILELAGTDAWKGDLAEMRKDRPRRSRAGIVAGVLDRGEEVTLESLMPSGGTIFSDGIEADFLAFNSGAVARVKAAAQTATLVVA